MMMPIIFLACLLSTADSATATQTNARLSLEIHAGAGFPTEDYLDTHVVSGFGITFPLKQRLFLSLDLGYWEEAVEENPDKFYEGRLKSIPFLASFRFFFARQKRVNPYAFLGAGYVFCFFEMEDIITIPEITIDQSVKNGPCFQVGIGIDVPISRSFGVFTEAAYFHRKSTVITMISDLNFGTSIEEFPVKHHSWIIQIGFKYFVKQRSIQDRTS
jgi:hypothetical protein